MQSGLRCGPLQQKLCASRCNYTRSSLRSAPKLKTAQPGHWAPARRVLVCSTDLQDKVESVTEEKRSDWSEDLAPASAGAESPGVCHAPALSQQQHHICHQPLPETPFETQLPQTHLHSAI